MSKYLTVEGFSIIGKRVLKLKIRDICFDRWTVFFKQIIHCGYYGQKTSQNDLFL